MPDSAPLSDRSVATIVQGVIAAIVLVALVVAGIMLDSPELVSTGAEVSSGLVDDLGGTPADP